MLSKTLAAVAVLGFLASATVASAQVGGGNELPKAAKAKGGMMDKSKMMKKHHSMKKMHKSM